jgi:5'-nucleotidase
LKRSGKRTPNVLLDAGDFFQGTPYFNYYGGELEFKLMSMMQYDASTIGNHDFDNGVEGLYAQMPPNLNSYRPIMTLKYDHGRPSKTIFQKNGIRVVFGIGIELDGLVDKKMYKDGL